MLFNTGRSPLPCLQAIQDALEKHRRDEQLLHEQLSNAPLIPTAQRQKSTADTSIMRLTFVFAEPAVAPAVVPAAAKPALEAVKLDVGRAELDEFLSDVKEDEEQSVPAPASLTDE